MRNAAFSTFASLQKENARFGRFQYSISNPIFLPIICKSERHLTLFFFTICLDKMMILPTSSPTQHKVVNYSGSSLADHTNVSQQVTKAKLEYSPLYNNMTIKNYFDLCSTSKKAWISRLLQQQQNRDRAVKNTGKSWHNILRKDKRTNESMSTKVGFRKRPTKCPTACSISYTLHQGLSHFNSHISKIDAGIPC